VGDQGGIIQIVKLKRRRTRLGELSTLILIAWSNCMEILCDLSMFCVCIMISLNSGIFPETA